MTREQAAKRLQAAIDFARNNRHSVASIGIGSLEDILTALTAPGATCDGSGQIAEGTGYANEEGGEEWRVWDCPGCPKCMEVVQAELKRLQSALAAAPQETEAGEATLVVPDAETLLALTPGLAQYVFPIPESPAPPAREERSALIERRARTFASFDFTPCDEDVLYHQRKLIEALDSTSDPASAPEGKECSHRNIVCLNGQEVCADCGVADPAPAPRCDGDGMIPETDADGQYTRTVYDCPGCLACTPAPEDARPTGGE